MEISLDLIVTSIKKKHFELYIYDNSQQRLVQVLLSIDRCPESVIQLVE